MPILELTQEQQELIKFITQKKEKNTSTFSFGTEKLSKEQDKFLAYNRLKEHSLIVKKLDDSLTVKVFRYSQFIKIKSLNISQLKEDIQQLVPFYISQLKEDIQQLAPFYLSFMEAYRHILTYLFAVIFNRNENFSTIDDQKACKIIDEFLSYNKEEDDFHKSETQEEFIKRLKVLDHIILTRHEEFLSLLTVKDTPDLNWISPLLFCFELLNIQQNDRLIYVNRRFYSEESKKQANYVLCSFEEIVSKQYKKVHSSRDQNKVLCFLELLERFQHILKRVKKFLELESICPAHFPTCLFKLFEDYPKKIATDIEQNQNKLDFRLKFYKAVFTKMDELLETNSQEHDSRPWLTTLLTSFGFCSNSDIDLDSVSAILNIKIITLEMVTRDGFGSNPHANEPIQWGTLTHDPDGDHTFSLFSGAVVDPANETLVATM